MLSEKEDRRLKKILKSNLSKERYEHCLNVAAQAVHLAEKYGGDADKAYIAGLMHDVTKEMSEKKQLALIRKAWLAGENEKVPRAKLHSLSGAAYLMLEMGIDDRDILNAVSSHTTGRAGMSLLEKIVYIADYTSAERKYNDVGIMRTLAEESLESAMRYALAFTITKCLQKGYYVCVESVEAYNDLLS